MPLSRRLGAAIHTPLQSRDVWRKIVPRGFPTPKFAPAAAAGAGPAPPQGLRHGPITLGSSREVARVPCVLKRAGLQGQALCRTHQGGVALASTFLPPQYCRSWVGNARSTGPAKGMVPASRARPPACRRRGDRLASQARGPHPLARGPPDRAMMVSDRRPRGGSGRSPSGGGPPENPGAICTRPSMRESGCAGLGDQPRNFQAVRRGFAPRFRSSATPPRYRGAGWRPLGGLGTCRVAAALSADLQPGPISRGRSTKARGYALRRGRIAERVGTCSPPSHRGHGPAPAPSRDANALTRAGARFHAAERVARAPDQSSWPGLQLQQASCKPPRGAGAAPRLPAQLSIAVRCRR